VTSLSLHSVFIKNFHLIVPKSVTNLNLSSLKLNQISNILQLQFLTLENLSDKTFHLFPRWKIFRRVSIVLIQLEDLKNIPRARYIICDRCNLKKLDGITSITKVFKSNYNRLSFRKSYRYIKLDLLKIFQNKSMVDISKLPSAYCLNLDFTDKIFLSKLWKQTITLNIDHHKKPLNCSILPDNIVFLSASKTLVQKNTTLPKKLLHLNAAHFNFVFNKNLKTIYNSVTNEEELFYEDISVILKNIPVKEILHINDPILDYGIHPKIQKISCIFHYEIFVLPDFQNLKHLSIQFNNELETYFGLPSFDLKNIEFLSLLFVNLSDFEFLNVTHKCQLKELHFKNTVNLNVKIIPKTVEFLTIDDETCVSLKELKCPVKKLFLSISENFDLQSIPISVDFLIYNFIDGDNEFIPILNWPYYIPFIKHAWHENYRVNPEYKKRIVGIIKFQRLFKKYYYGGIVIDSNKMISRHLLRILEDVGHDISELKYLLRSLKYN